VAGRSLFPWIACLAIAASVSALFWPGYLSADSLDQLAQARFGITADSHPPAMSWMWRLLDKIAGEGGLLALHQAAYWAGLAWLFTSMAPRAGWRFLPIVLLAGFFPPVFTLSVTLWKDTAVMVFLLLGFAALGGLLQDTRRPRWMHALFWLSFVYAVLVRHNTLPAVLPALFLYFSAIGGLGRKRAAAAALVALLALFPLGGLLARALSIPVGTASQGFILHDLAALSLSEGKNLFPPERLRVPENQALPALAKAFDVQQVNTLAVGPDAPLRTALTAHEYADLRDAWIRGIVARPGAYLAHRWRHFADQIGLREKVFYPMHLTYDAHPRIVLRPAESQLRKGWSEWLWTTGQSWMFRTYLYALVLIGLLVHGVWRWWSRSATSSDALRTALVGSGLLYLLPYFFVSPSCDFRYNSWTVMAAVTGLASMVLRFGTREKNVAT
jgi:hypothetical protein